MIEIEQRTNGNEVTKKTAVFEKRADGNPGGGQEKKKRKMKKRECPTQTSREGRHQVTAQGS